MLTIRVNIEGLRVQAYWPHALLPIRHVLKVNYTHGVYYHRDTAACTLADNVTSFVYIITTLVEKLVPVGNQGVEALRNETLVRTCNQVGTAEISSFTNRCPNTK
jgi:hypothetical protein